MNKSLVLSFLLLASPGTHASEKPHTTQTPQIQNLDFQQVLKQQGFVWLQDSGSNYIFQRDGRFQSAPMSLGGRTLQGFWTQQDKTEPVVEVEAIRSWENGRSILNDFRKISFYVGDSGTLEKQKSALWLDGKRKVASVYKTYWFVDSLERMAKPNNWQARKSKLSSSPLLLIP